MSGLLRLQSISEMPSDEIGENVPEPPLAGILQQTHDVALLFDGVDERPFPQEERVGFRGI